MEEAESKDMINNQDVYRIIENNKDVPFVNKIIKKRFRDSLNLSKYRGKFVVHPSSLSMAVDRNNFVEFSSSDAANYFIDHYKSYHDPVPVEQMNQQQFETSMEVGSSKFVYSGVIEKV